MIETVKDFKYPYDLNAESSLIASCILDNNYIGDVLRALKPECFYHLPHQIIFTEIINMHGSKIPVDIVTLKDRLLTSGTLDKVGGIENIVAILDSVPTPSNAVFYAGIILEKYLLRLAINNANNIIMAATRDASIDSVRELYRNATDMLDGHNEIENQRKFKMMLERDFVRHLIFADGHYDVKNNLTKIVKEFKLVPAHFSDLVCQCLYRTILAKASKNEHFALPYLVDYNKRDLGLGFIGVQGLIEFFGDEIKSDYSAEFLEDYAKKIVQSNDYLLKLCQIVS